MTAARRLAARAVSRPGRNTAPFSRRSSDFDLSPISTPWSRVGADRGSNTTPIHTPRAQRSIRSRAAATWAAQERG
jgi:hypothetical protein